MKDERVDATLELSANRRSVAPTKERNGFRLIAVIHGLRIEEDCGFRSEGSSRGREEPPQSLRRRVGTGGDEDDTQWDAMRTIEFSQCLGGIKVERGL